jgi:hypothetical protein
VAVTWFLALLVLLGLAVAAVAIVLVSNRGGGGGLWTGSSPARRRPDPRGFEVIERHEPK